MALVDDSLHRALGIIVNGLRRDALRAQAPVSRHVPLGEIVALAGRLADGQGGHEVAADADDEGEGLELESIERAKNIPAAFRAALPRLVAPWNGRVNGDVLELTVAVPQRAVPRYANEDAVELAVEAAAPRAKLR